MMQDRDLQRVSAFFVASRQTTYASGRPYLIVQFRQKE